MLVFQVELGWYKSLYWDLNYSDHEQLASQAPITELSSSKPSSSLTA